MSAIRNYDDFVANVPISTYEELKKNDIPIGAAWRSYLLWPGTVKWYHQSHREQRQQIKFIPISNDGLRNIHYKGGADVVAIYLEISESRIFDGRSHLSLVVVIRLIIILLIRLWGI